MNTPKSIDIRPLYISEEDEFWIYGTTAVSEGGKKREGRVYVDWGQGKITSTLMDNMDTCHPLLEGKTPEQIAATVAFSSFINTGG